MKSFDMQTVLVLSTLLASGPLWALTELPLSRDGHGRPMADVRVNGQGPFPFVLDTGASSSALSNRLVQRLDIEPMRGVHVQAHGAAGSEEAPKAYQLGSLQLGDLTREGEIAISHLSPKVSGAVGVLGNGIYGDSRVAFDFAADRLRITESGSAAPKGSARAPLRFSPMGRLLLVRVEVGGVPVQALVDTGARTSFGNPKLMQALGYRESDERLEKVHHDALGITATPVDSLAAKARLQLAGLDLGERRVEFADLPVFDTLGIGGGPAMILGMDVIGSFKELAVDYGRQEVQVLL